MSKDETEIFDTKEVVLFDDMEIIITRYLEWLQSVHHRDIPTEDLMNGKQVLTAKILGYVQTWYDEISS